MKVIHCLTLLVWFGMGAVSVLAGPVFPYKTIGDGGPATSAVLTLVDGVASDPEGNIYISHRSQNRIRKVSPDGIITTIAGNGVAGYGGDGGPALEASLNFPAGLAFHNGSLYVADRNNHRVRRIHSDGIITTVVGVGEPDCCGDGGPAVEAMLNLPSDIALDAAGNLYISDRSNNRIRRVDLDGTITTVAGIGSPGYGGDYGRPRMHF